MKFCICLVYQGFLRTHIQSYLFLIISFSSTSPRRSRTLRSTKCVVGLATASPSTAGWKIVLSFTQTPWYFICKKFCNDKNTWSELYSCQFS